MRVFQWTVLAAALAGPFVVSCFPAVTGVVRGIVHDPQHRPISGAEVEVLSTTSAWKAETTSDSAGDFIFVSVPIGEYVLRASAPGFNPGQMSITVVSGSSPVLHLPLALAASQQTVQVSANAPEITPTATSQTMVSRLDVQRTPGADRTNSLALITDYIPGAYMVHDQLHVRGGHQVSWVIDGVPVPNTSIASNVGPQFDPKDIDFVDIQRGGYTAEYGDRTYAVLNLNTRSGFERSKEGELVAGYGSYNQSNDQLNFGSHTDRLAYYVSISGNRSDLGLETPSAAVLHDMDSGESAFASVIDNLGARDQLRLAVSVRGDHYQVPNTPDQEAAGISDVDKERDEFANFSWLHTFTPNLILTVSPFLHFNRAAYFGGRSDFPTITGQQRSSLFAGGQAELSWVRGAHSFKTGVYSFEEHDRDFLSLVDRATGTAFSARESPAGNEEAGFVQDEYKPAPWVTLQAGLRATRFSGLVHESVADPRLGAALTIPRLRWVAHAYYGRFYQAPPLDTIGGPALSAAAQAGFGFLPLHGERDEQHEFGLAVPVRNWVVEADQFRTAARTFFDHDVLGNSNIFLPLNIGRARIRGWEATLRSPRLLRRASLHAVFSHQYAEGFGGVIGGLTSFSPPVDAYYFLDHDQRYTADVGASVSLPWQAWGSTQVNYGSGFLQGDGPAHLPSHTTLDLAVGKSIGERWSVNVSGLNVGNHRYLLDESNTFGGTHFADPREIVLEVRYRFRY